MKNRLTVDEFCEYFGISQQAFYNWVRRGILKRVEDVENEVEADIITIGNRNWIKKESVERIEREGTTLHTAEASSN